MTIISSISLGVCWFDLSLLICQTMLIGLTDRKIKCRSRNTSGKQEKTGEREEPRVSEGRGVRSSLSHTSWVALKVSTGHSAIFILSPVKWGSSLEYVTEISFSWELSVICAVVQSHIHVRLFETPWTHSTQGFPVLHNLPELAQTCPSSGWCHPTISSTVIPFSFSQSFPASGSVPMSQLFASVSQSTGASASVSVLPRNFL